VKVGFIDILSKSAILTTNTSLDGLSIGGFTERRLQHARNQQLNYPLRDNIPIFLNEIVDMSIKFMYISR